MCIYTYIYLALEKKLQKSLKLVIGDSQCQMEGTEMNKVILEEEKMKSDFQAHKVKSKLKTEARKPKGFICNDK